MAQVQVYFDDVEVGDDIPTLEKNCSTRQLVMFAAAARDFYEIHYDLEFARKQGLDGLLIHGALKNAFLGQLVYEWAAPGGQVLEYGCSYRGMDGPDEDLRCGGRVAAKRQEGARHLVDLEIWVQRSDGTITTPGTAVVVLPTRAQR